MDDFRNPPRFWIAFSILCITLAVAFVMAVYTTVTAHAQQQCAPLESLVTELGTNYQERPIWEGVVPTPQGPIEAVLFQSEKGTWTFVVIRGVTACPVAAGEDGTPISAIGRGA